MDGSATSVRSSRSTETRSPGSGGSSGAPKKVSQPASSSAAQLAASRAPALPGARDPRRTTSAPDAGEQLSCPLLQASRRAREILTALSQDAGAPCRPCGGQAVR